MVPEFVAAPVGVLEGVDQLPELGVDVDPADTRDVVEGELVAAVAESEGRVAACALARAHVEGVRDDADRLHRLALLSLERSPVVRLGRVPGAPEVPPGRGQATAVVGGSVADGLDVVEVVDATNRCRVVVARLPRSGCVDQGVRAVPARRGPVDLPAVGLRTVGVGLPGERDPVAATGHVEGDRRRGRRRDVVARIVVGERAAEGLEERVTAREHPLVLGLGLTVEGEPGRAVVAGRLELGPENAVRLIAEARASLRDHEPDALPRGERVGPEPVPERVAARVGLALSGRRVAGRVQEAWKARRLHSERVTGRLVPLRHDVVLRRHPTDAERVVVRLVGVVRADPVGRRRLAGVVGVVRRRGVGVERHDARERARSEPSGRVGGRAVVGGGDLERPAEVVVGHGAAGEVAVPRELGAELLALGVREQPVAARVVHGVLAPAGRVADHVPRLGGHGHPVLEVRDDALQRLVRELDFVVVVRVARVGQDVLDDVVVVVELLAELHHPPLHRDAEQRVDPADEHEVRLHVGVDAVDHHRGGRERLVAVDGHDREGVLAHQLELDGEHLAHAGHARPDVDHAGGVRSP